jgi:phosphatidylglycerophosphate synthase
MISASPESALITWTGYHAILMLTSLALVLGGAPPLTSAALACLSFGALTYISRWKWTPSGRYGAANLITVFRFLMIGALLSQPPLPPLYGAALAATVLGLDGVDGWLARRSGDCSSYGEFLDKEVDAFLTLALCLALYQSQRFGVWILIPGSLRYAFVLFIQCVRPPVPKERTTRWSRAAGVVLLGTLLVCLLPLGAAGTWLAAFATTAAIGSFSASVWALYRG